MSGIVIKPYRMDLDRGGDIQIIDLNSTIQDYLDAINDFILTTPLDRLWTENRTTCLSCHRCCHEPLPVTSIDVINLTLATQKSFTKVFQYLWVEVQGAMVDITLRRDQNQNCCFLSATGICEIYPYRPLVCQTFICCVTTPKMEDLRSYIVNTGMDDLVRRAILVFDPSGQTIPYNRAYKPRVRLENWPANTFSGKKRYQEIMLAQVIPKKSLADYTV